MTIDLMLGDCAGKLKGIAEESVDLVVTSPPYDNLRAYEGYSFDFEAVARQLYRVVKTGGVVVWVVGDATIDGSETGTSFRQALHFKGIGFNLHDTMIYQKEIPTWNETSRRYRQNVEYMFVLSKGQVRTFNPIEDQKVKNLSPRQCKSNRNGAAHYEMYVPEKAYTARNNIWKYAVGGSSIAHPAVFPLQLALDHISTWSNEGDLVLDPFMGSGTTGVAAACLKRSFTGIEVAESYFELAEKRIKDGEAEFLGIRRPPADLLDYENAFD